jgi:hypothetical protein
VQPLLGGEQRTDKFARSIRFAPPLVIEDSDLRKGISIIEESLRELDQVCILLFYTGQDDADRSPLPSLTASREMLERRREP